MTAAIPGIRIGQVWRRRPSGRGRARPFAQVTGHGLTDVHYRHVDADGRLTDTQRSTPKEAWLKLWDLASEAS